MKKLSRLAVMLALVLALTACSGGADTPSPDEQTEGQHPVTDAAKLEGQWTSPREYSVLFGRPGPLYLPDLHRPHGAGPL